MKITYKSGNNIFFKSLSTPVTGTYCWCDQIIGQLQVSEIGAKFGGYNLQKVFHLGDVEPRNLGPERNETPESGIF